MSVERRLARTWRTKASACSVSTNRHYVGGLALVRLTSSAAVPEPASFGLLATGGAMLLWWRNVKIEPEA
jgi:hypothetical protein